MNLDELEKFSEEILAFSKSEEAKKLSKKQLEDLEKEITNCMNAIISYKKVSGGNE